MMGRFRSFAIVLWLVALIGAMPLIVPSASAAQRNVTVSTRNLAPFVMTDSNGKSGFTIDIVEEIARRAGWNITYLENATVAEMLKSLDEKKADAAAAAISITSERAEKFDFSQPFMSGGPQIMVPVGANKPSSPGIMDFIKLLFSKTVLVWLIAALILTLIPAHITWLLERRHPDSMVSKSYFPGIFQSFRWGIGSMAGAADDSPRASAARIMAIMWGFICILFIAYYTATLTANITVKKFDAQIKSPSDLAGKNVCTVAETTSAAALQRYGVEFEGVKTVDDCFKGLDDGKFAAVVYDAPVLSYYANESGGTVQLVGPVLRPEEYGIAFRNGSDLRKTVDAELLSMREDGTYYKIKQKWFGEDATSK
jgi:polar amino acid transport system substrate-binding protein